MNEDKYREALRNRTIEPSPGSWDTLSKKLDAHQNKRKNRNWLILKIASVVLIFVSIGFYFTREEKETFDEPVIAAPNSIKIQQTTPDLEDLNATETAAAPEEKSLEIPSQNDPVKEETVAVKVNFKESVALNDSALEEVDQITVLDSVTEAILLTETLDVKEENIDDEVEALLNRSRIKLVVNGQLSSKKVVDANALLNSVEDDIYKDLKQKLIEKISKTLKNPKEVVTSRDDR